MKKLFQLLTLLIVAYALSSCARIASVDPNPPSVKTAAFKKQMEQVVGAKFTSGNHVEPLYNGNSYFPKMLADVRSAKKSIEVESFIMMKARITDRFVKALSAKAKQGVDVKVVLDNFGSVRLNKESKKKLRDAGVQLVFFRPWNSNPFRLNSRTHRKFLIVDERVCYMGGAGFADAWNGSGKHKWSWRDNQYRITGPAVKEARDDFYRLWKGEKEQTKVSQKAGSMDAQIVDGNPRSGNAEIARSIILGLNAAKSEVLISMAYTCPPSKVKKAILKAQKRGVKVKILSSGHIIDSRICRRCAHHFWKKALKAGVEIYEYQPTMMHSKVIVIDRHLVITGAANMDYRSYFINEENNINILSTKLALQEVAQFNKDLKLSKKLKKEDILPFKWNAWVMQSQL